MPDLEEYDPFGDSLRATPTDYEGAPETAPKAKKRAKPANFTDATNRLFERRGFHVGPVEQTVMHTKWNRDESRSELYGSSKRDLFGFADFVVVHRDLPGTTYVQVCRKGDMSTRIRSACTHDAAELAANKRTGKKPVQNANRVAVLTDLLLAGNRFWVLGFEKVGNRWQPTIVDVNLDVIRLLQSGARPVVSKLPAVVLAMTRRDRIAWLDKMGLSPVVVSQNCHTKVRITDPYDGRTLVVVMPSSPSHSKGHRHMQSMVRRWMREGGKP